MELVDRVRQGGTDDVRAAVVVPEQVVQVEVGQQQRRDDRGANGGQPDAAAGRGQAADVGAAEPVVFARVVPDRDDSPPAAKPVPAVGGQ